MARKTEVIQIRVDETEKALWKAAAMERMMAVSDWIRLIAREEVARMEKEGSW